ncbi:hypothetical protein Neuguinea42_13420 [Helicobacter pylori]
MENEKRIAKRKPILSIPRTVVVSKLNIEFKGFRDFMKDFNDSFLKNPTQQPKTNKNKGDNK